MNKVLALFLVGLLTSQVSANFLKLNFLGNGDNHYEENGQEGGEFSGSWNNKFETDNGELVDSGEFNGHAFLYDNGEFQVVATYNRQFYHREVNDHNEFNTFKLSDNGEISHIGRREAGKNGTLSQEEITPIIIKRLKQNPVY